MLARNVERKIRNFLGNKFWARRYFVTTVGRDDEVIRAYIRNQELADQQLDQLELKILSRPKIQSITQHPLKPPLAVPNQTSSFAGGYWLTDGAAGRRSRHADVPVTGRAILRMKAPVSTGAFSLGQIEITE